MGKQKLINKLLITTSLCMMFVLLCTMTHAEYTTPCTNGSRFDGNLVNDICGSGSFAIKGTPLTVQNSTLWKAPISPNIAGINFSAAGTNSYVSSGVPQTGAIRELCMMVWFNSSFTVGIDSMLSNQGISSGIGFRNGDFVCGNNGSIMYMDSDGGGGSLLCKFARNISKNVFHSLLVYTKTDGSSNSVGAKGNITTFLDGVLWFNITNGINNYWYASSDFGIGGIATSNDASFKGVLDHFVVVQNSQCTQDMADAYNITASAAVANINITLYNTSQASFSNIAQGQYFFIKANYSFGGITSTTANCFYNSTSLSSVHQTTGVNYTLVGKSLSVIVNHNSTGYSNSTIIARVCRNGLPPYNNVQVLINGTLFDTIPSSNLVSCSSGFHEYNNISTNLVQQSYNISLACSECSNSRNVTVVQNNNLYPQNLMVVYKSYNPYPAGTLDYNASTGFYEDNVYHAKLTGGNFNISVNCNSSTFNTTFLSQYSAPVASIDSITDVNGEKIFLNGTNIEAGNVSIVGDCSGFQISTGLFNITYSNNTLIKSVSYPEESLNVTQNYLTENGIYNVSLSCRNAAGNVTTIKKWFQLNDTVIPTVVWVSPKIDNSSIFYKNEMFSVDVIGYDLDLFSMLIECFNPLGVKIFSNYTTNISDNAFQILGNSLNITVTGTGFCNASIKDAHTLKDISDKLENPLNIDKSLIFSKNDDTLNITIYSLEKIEAIKQKDRYSFIPVTNEKGFTSITYFVDCSDILYYREHSRYNAHFVCGSMWTDFDITGLKKTDYKVTKVQNNRYRIDINNVNKLSSYQTNSVGVLNELITSASFEIEERITITAVTIDSVLLISLVVIWVALCFFGLAYYSIFLSFAGIYGIFLSFAFVSMYGNLSYIFTALNAFIVVMGGFLMFEK